MEREEQKDISGNAGLYFISSKRRDGIRNCNLDTTLEHFRNKPVCEVDTETTGYFNHNNRILTLQLGDSNSQFVIDFQELSQRDKNRISNEILNNKNIVKIFHNAKFDIKFLWFEGLEVCSVYDTLLAECLLNAGRETPDGFLTLASLAERYCNVKLNKEIRGQIHREGLSTRVIQYAGDDVKCLSVIREAQMKKLQDLRMANDNCQDIYTVLGLENNAVLAFAMIEYYGMKLDTEKWSKVTELILEKEAEILHQLDQEVFNDSRLKKYCTIYQDLFTAPEMRTTVNWASPQQKLEVLNQIGKFESTKQQELEKVKRDYPLVNLLIQYNKISKLLNSFAIPLPKEINKYTGRIHTDFWQILNTGRVSSSNPNLQQIPARTEIGGKMRECFVTEDGYKIVGGDFSGCELRIIAEFSEDPVWLDAFKNGEDLHSKLCSLTFGIPVEDVKKPSHFKPDLKYRDIQKTINFGL